MREDRNHREKVGEENKSRSPRDVYIERDREENRRRPQPLLVGSRARDSIKDGVGKDDDERLVISVKTDGIRGPKGEEKENRVIVYL